MHPPRIRGRQSASAATPRRRAATARAAGRGRWNGTVEFLVAGTGREDGRPGRGRPDPAITGVPVG
ncbi:hypothetical protein ADK60_29940 [Streptomyces sp. XY431]|nr:hypothetical protein ADK60_29940 [Streptomyces sp. XY431]